MSLENSVTCVKPAFNGRFSHQVTYPEGYKLARHRWNLIRLVDFWDLAGWVDFREKKHGVPP